MGLFTVAERELIKDLFINFTYQNHDIVSVILVGSGAAGF